MGQAAAGDPSWVMPLLRAASLLAMIAIVLKVVLAVLVLVNSEGYFSSPIRGID